MNRLIQVNIGGLVFQIDEGAYLKLEKYLNAIKKKYENEEGGKEIISDIELRIAEIFTEQAESGRAIMMQDVERIIETLGQPEDFEENEAEYSYTTEGKQRARRFFRDGQNRMLGGVCSGFGAYFNVDPLWIRLLFLAAFFFGGTGFLLYIVLWVIMPEAKTTSEKLEMRGERVTVSNIERSIKKGAQKVSDKASEMGDELKETFSEERMQKTRSSLGEFVESAVETIRPAVRIFFKIFVLAIVLACVAALVAFGVVLLTDMGKVAGRTDFVIDHLFETAFQGNLMLFTGIAIVAIPILTLLVRGIKYLLNVKFSFKAFDWTMMFLWITCIVAVFVIGVQLANDFSEDARTSHTVDVVQPAGGILLVEMEDYPERGRFFGYEWPEDEDNDLIVDGDTVYFRDIDFSIEKSDDSLYVLSVIKSARGESREEARKRSGALNYPVIQEDSVLLLPSSILLGEGELWRNQRVDLVLRVPDSGRIVLDRDLDHYFRYNDATDNMDHDDLFNTPLQMTKSGLKPVY
jgi:phage shock protein C